MKNSKIRFVFDTTPYKRSHGADPKGRGSWAFRPEERKHEAPRFSPSMTYTEAKRWAKAQDWLVPEEWINAGHAVVLQVLP